MAIRTRSIFILEVLEIQEEIYPGEHVSFWVFAPLGSAMGQAARLPSPTLRVGRDHVAITLYNTHYLPHTIHRHGTNQPNAMDGVPHITQHEVPPANRSPIVSRPVRLAPIGITATCRIMCIR